MTRIARAFSNWSATCCAVMGLLVATGCESEVVSDEEAATELGRTAEALTLQDRINQCAADPRVTQGLVPASVCVGADLFFREPFGGNGRTCGTCHPVGNNFVIDPSFIATLPSTDPLFIAEQVPALAQLERPDLMRQFGLILENLDGFSDPTHRFVMRSVPHTLGLATSVTPEAIPTDGTTIPPIERTGWSGDGAPGQGGLRDFQTGAITQHYTRTLNRVPGTDFILATSAELDSIDAFLRAIGRTNDITLSALSLSEPGAEAGRTTFLSPAARCNGCHSNAGANTAGFNRNFNTGIERLRLQVLNQQGIPSDGGFGGNTAPAFNFDSNGDGINDSFGNGTFNVPPLIEAADTGPFFHTNAFATIEDAIGFFNTPTFNSSPAGLAGTPIALTATQQANVGRFLRVLNAALNCQMALARINADIQIIPQTKNQFRDLQQTLARLAQAEVDDALQVLGAVSALNADAQTQLTNAHNSLDVAATHASHVQRLRAAQDALTAVTAANALLSATPASVQALTFNIGAGTLMF